MAWGLLAAWAPAAQAETGPPGETDKILLLRSDAAALEDSMPRQDFVCAVKLAGPELGFDLRLQAGYRVLIPWNEVAAGGRLDVITRLTPIGRPDHAFYRVDRFVAPRAARHAPGDALAEGRFALGEGRYRVDWLARDAGGRICSTHGEFAARLPEGARGAAAPLPPETVRSEPRDLFAPEPPIERGAGRVPRVKLLLHWAPDRPGAVTLRAEEESALVAMLRSLAREPRIRLAGIAAFDAQQHRVLLEQCGAVDFPGLGRALRNHAGGSVDYHRLVGGNADRDFLQSLAEPAPGDEEPVPDAVVFLGPKMPTGEGFCRIAKPGLRQHVPVFFLNWAPEPQANPWRDPITAMVQAAGGRVYRIRRPADWAAAWQDLLRRLRSEGDGVTRPVAR